jgi:hypothetical protein
VVSSSVVSAYADSIIRVAGFVTIGILFLACFGYAILHRRPKSVPLSLQVTWMITGGLSWVVFGGLSSESVALGDRAFLFIFMGFVFGIGNGVSVMRACKRFLMPVIILLAIVAVSGLNFTTEYHDYNFYSVPDTRIAFWDFASESAGVPQPWSDKIAGMSIVIHPQGSNLFATPHPYAHISPGDLQTKDVIFANGDINLLLSS